MLQAHSLLWHYLWLAPNLLLLVLAVLLWQRGSGRKFPAFLVFAITCAVGQLAAYSADVLPFVSPPIYWRVDWANLILDGVLKFVVIGEIFGQVFGSYSDLARLGKAFIRVIGIFLVLAAALIAAYAPNYEFFGIISGANLLEQSTYLVESGLLVFILLFTSFFHLKWSRPLLGIAVGLAISACVHLGTWAFLANGGLPSSKRILLVFLNMATYHACVLVWFYYLLVPAREVAKIPVSSVDTRPGLIGVSASTLTHDENLEIWNREMERLLHP